MHNGHVNQAKPKGLKMTNRALLSERFHMAHRMAKQLHKAGDCYAVTFGECLKAGDALIKSVKERKAGEAVTIEPATILAMVSVSGMTLKGWVNYGEGRAEERFSTFRQCRMHQYVTSLLEQAESYSLEIQFDFDDWAPSTYKVVRK